MSLPPDIIAKLGKSEQAHKYDHGHALIVSGPATRTGAARLAARGALRIGAGLVTIAAPSDAMAEHAAQLNAIMLRRVEDCDALGKLLGDPRINALCIGPALGLDARAVALLGAVLSSAKRGSAPRPAVVVDADGLTLLAQRPELMAGLDEPVVLTPHAGEFARLFPDLAERWKRPPEDPQASSKVEAASAAAKRCGAVVVLKGPDTVVAAPDGSVQVCDAIGERAAPWLATAGSGDVLAGFITGLLARGFAPVDAAQAAVWVHLECARRFGPGLIAEDLPEMVPGVLGALL